jgi:hypothetical protein
MVLTKALTEPTREGMVFRWGILPVLHRGKGMFHAFLRGLSTDILPSL